jgi:hypothetical protein
MPIEPTDATAPMPKRALPHLPGTGASLNQAFDGRFVHDCPRVPEAICGRIVK